MKYTFIVFTLMIICLSSCVTQKKFNTEVGKCKANNDSLTSVLKLNFKERNKLQSFLDEANQHITALTNDSLATHDELDKQKKLSAELQSANDLLVKQKKELLDNSSSRNQQLNEDLQKKQQELDAKQTELENKELSINGLNNELKVRMLKVKELENILNSKDSAANNLKRKITAALEGYDESELKVERKNGKVYVSMAEKLLFKSGSAEVDIKGKGALKKLAEVLNKNTDINVTVEGHTDNAPLNHDAYPRDNWDLSVLRSTTIVKVLTDAKVEPKRVTAAGHGEFFPVAENTTKSGKSLNRRTEIILTPKLDELIKVLEN
jgi:chemotaxis protein MotB